MLEPLQSTPVSRPRSNSSPEEDANRSSAPAATVNTPSRHHSEKLLPVPEEEPAVAESALERRHQQLNQLFGIKVWKSQIRHRPIESRSAEVRSLYKEPTQPPDVVKTNFCSLDNIIYTLLFGWWIFLIYLFVAAVFALFCQRHYARLSLSLAQYFFFPFGRFILRNRPLRYPDSADADERAPINVNVGATPTFDKRTVSNQQQSQPQPPKVQSGTVADFGISQHDPSAGVSWGCTFGSVLWYFLVTVLLLPVHLLVTCITWFSVFMIPMAKLHRTAATLLFTAPHQLQVSDGYPGPGAEIELCVYQAANAYYYKYSVGGMNVIPVNLLVFVAFTVVIGYVPPFTGIHPYAKFLFSLISIVPLAYYIGMALSSISAQTTLAVGAVLNATFGSIIELILFFNALRRGFTELTVAAVTGGLLGNMLLLPGLSMICGGVKFRNQSFNKVSAGVSSVLLIMSIVGIFTPSICYRTFGHYSFDCKNCTQIDDDASNSSYVCRFCNTESVTDLDLHMDPVYLRNIQPLTWIIAALLPCAYIIGLLFTLKTHADIYNPPPHAASRHASQDTQSLLDRHGSGHSHYASESDAPEWSRTACLVILLVSTLLLALVSEELVDAIQPTLASSGITETFMGVSVLAVVPSTAEYVNAIQFALQNNVALSIEIGSSGAVQIAMLQVPALVLISVLLSVFSHTPGTFPLIFPFLDVMSVVFCVLIVNYVSIEGRSNYFLGSGLLFTWVLLIAAFYFMNTG